MTRRRAGRCCSSASPPPADSRRGPGDPGRAGIAACRPAGEALGVAVDRVADRGESSSLARATAPRSRVENAGLRVPPVRGRAVGDREVERLDVVLGEARPRRGARRSRPRCAHANWPGRVGIAAARRAPRSTSSRDGQHAPGVLLAAPVQAASATRARRAEHAARLAQRGLGIGHQHVAPAAQDAVEARRLDVDARLGVDLLEAHVADAELLGAALGGLRASRARSRSRSASRRARSARPRAARCRPCRRPARAACGPAAGRSRRSSRPRPASSRRAARRAATPSPRPARPSACGSARGSRQGAPRRRATLAQVGAADLARLGARQLVDELERLRDLEARASRSRQCARSAACGRSARRRAATTSAVIASPQSGCGRAKTAASATSGCSASTASTSAGDDVLAAA